MRRLVDCVRHTDLGLAHHRAFWEAVEALLPAGSLANDGQLGSIWVSAVPAKEGLDPAWMGPAVAILHEFEGLRLSAYQCSSGVWTIGWGSTRIFGRPVRQGDTISRSQADAQFRLDVDTMAGHLFRLLPAARQMQPNQVAALVSFVYNIGPSAFEESTMRRRLLAGEEPAAVVPVELRRWNKDGSGVNQGLVRRREAELRLFGSQARQPAPDSETRRQWVSAVKALNLSQPDEVTCQAACIAMAVGDRDIYGIRRKLQARAAAVGSSAGDPAVMGHVIRSYGRPYTYDGNASMAKVQDWLKAGEFLITHGWFTGSGHVICLDGLKQLGTGHLVDVKDPWSEFNPTDWAYNKGSRFFDGFYSDVCIYAACVAGTSVTSARRAFQLGRIEPQKGGMWVHRFHAR
jgi:lysozyme